MNANRGRNAVTAPLMSPYVAVLALAALLFCIVALHSEMTAHDQPRSGSSMAAPAAVTADVTADVTTATARATATAVAVVLVDSLADNEQFGMFDCAVLGMACALMLVLVVPVFLTRWPAVFRRPCESSDARLTIINVVTVPTPSLSALSILRV